MISHFSSHPVIGYRRKGIICVNINWRYLTIWVVLKVIWLVIFISNNLCFQNLHVFYSSVTIFSHIYFNFIYVKLKVKSKQYIYMHGRIRKNWSLLVWTFDENFTIKTMWNIYVYMVVIFNPLTFVYFCYEWKAYL